MLGQTEVPWANKKLLPKIPGLLSSLVEVGFVPRFPQILPEFPGLCVGYCLPLVTIPKMRFQWQGCSSRSGSTWNIRLELPIPQWSGFGFVSITGLKVWIQSQDLEHGQVREWFRANGDSEEENEDKSCTQSWPPQCSSRCLHALGTSVWSFPQTQGQRSWVEGLQSQDLKHGQARKKGRANVDTEEEVGDNAITQSR